MSNKGIFNRAWAQLEAVGACDSMGGMQYRRLREAFCHPNFATELVKDWIRREANATPPAATSRVVGDVNGVDTIKWHLTEEQTSPGQGWVHAYACLSDLVMQCEACKNVREHLDLLHDAETDPDLQPEVQIPGLDDLRVKCCSCSSRGWRLSDKGRALVKLLQELLPFQPAEKEIPF